MKKFYLSKLNDLSFRQPKWIKNITPILKIKKRLEEVFIIVIELTPKWRQRNVTCLWQINDEENILAFSKLFQ
jgi:hypothetical protein